MVPGLRISARVAIRAGERGSSGVARSPRCRFPSETGAGNTSVPTRRSRSGTRTDSSMASRPAPQARPRRPRRPGAPAPQAPRSGSGAAARPQLGAHRRPPPPAISARDFGRRARLATAPRGMARADPHSARRSAKRPCGGRAYPPAVGWKPDRNALRGRVAVVAGATRGAGRGIAAALGEAGATVVCTGRTSRSSRGRLRLRPARDDRGDRGARHRARRRRGRRSRSTTSTPSRSQTGRTRPRDHGHIDVLVNDIWGAELLKGGPAEWNTPIWELDLDGDCASCGSPSTPT